MTPTTPRLILGLLGGIASGKSTVSRLILSISAGRLFDADVVARESLASCAKDGRLAAALGAKYVGKDGVPDRKAIASLVFRDAKALRALERLTHPYVTARIADAVDDHRSGRGDALLVLDVPLLIEVGLERRCDALWFIDAPDELRYARAEKSLGFSRDEVQRREVAQSPLDRKRARADLVIDNSGAPESLSAQVVAGLRALGCRVE